MFPLKNIFRKNAPTASLPADWFNTVANILNDIKGVGCHIEKPAGGTGRGWQIVVDTSSEGGFRRFLVVDLGGGIITVYTGDVTRNGYTVSLATDSGAVLYQTVSGVGSDDFVILHLIGSSGTGSPQDPAIHPTALEIIHPTTRPSDTDGNVYFVLGKFTGAIWEQYHLGDIDDHYTPEYLELFGIYDRNVTTFKLHGPPLGNSGTWLYGEKVEVVAGTGGKKLDDEITISADETCIWIKYLLQEDDDPPIVSLEIGTGGFPDGDDSTRIFPLWVFPFGNGAIKWNEVFDMRDSKHVDELALSPHEYDICIAGEAKKVMIASGDPYDP